MRPFTACTDDAFKANEQRLQIWEDDLTARQKSIDRANSAIDMKQAQLKAEQAMLQQLHNDTIAAHAALQAATTQIEQRLSEARLQQQTLQAVSFPQPLSSAATNRQQTPAERLSAISSAIRHAVVQAGGSYAPVPVYPDRDASHEGGNGKSPADHVEPFCSSAGQPRPHQQTTQVNISASSQCAASQPPGATVQSVCEHAAGRGDEMEGSIPDHHSQLPPTDSEAAPTEPSVVRVHAVPSDPSAMWLPAPLPTGAGVQIPHRSRLRDPRLMGAGAELHVHQREAVTGSGGNGVGSGVSGAADGLHCGPELPAVYSGTHVGGGKYVQFGRQRMKSVGNHYKDRPCRKCAHAWNAGHENYWNCPLYKCQRCKRLDPGHCTTKCPIVSKRSLKSYKQAEELALHDDSPVGAPNSDYTHIHIAEQQQQQQQPIAQPPEGHNASSAAHDRRPNSRSSPPRQLKRKKICHAVIIASQERHNASHPGRVVPTCNNNTPDSASPSSTPRAFRTAVQVARPYVRHNGVLSLSGKGNTGSVQGSVPGRAAVGRTWTGGTRRADPEMGSETESEDGLDEVVRQMREEQQQRQDDVAANQIVDSASDRNTSGIRPKAGAESPPFTRVIREPNQQAAVAALQADAPELLSVLKQHGILEHVALLEHEGDNCEVVTGASKFSALSQVLEKVFATDAAAEGHKPPPGHHSGIPTPVRSMSRPIAALQHLIGAANESKDAGHSVEWGWCRPLRSFIFVFASANRIVLETPEYGNATFFFEIEQPMPIAVQVQRLITVMGAHGVGKQALLCDALLEEASTALSLEEQRVLQAAGWSPGTGLRTLLNFTGERVYHKDADGSGRTRSDWMKRIQKALERGRDGGRITRTLGLA